MKAAVLCVVVALLVSREAAATVVEAGGGEGRSYVGFLSGEAQAAYRGSMRIISGWEVNRGEVPYMAGLLIALAAGTGLCGGSVLSPDRVLTAAHCWFDGNTQADYLQVVLGGHRINELEDHSLRLNTDRVSLHPDWQPALIRNDIAVVHLPTRVEFTQYIRPVALPTLADETFAGEVGYAYGWGITSNGGTNASPYLLGVSMNIIPNNVCSITSPILATEHNICTSGLQGGAVCNGDSGGPLVVYRDAQPMLVGVTSFRHLLGCESIMPSMFARVTSFLNFIHAEME